MKNRYIKIYDIDQEKKVLQKMEALGMKWIEGDKPSSFLASKDGHMEHPFAIIIQDDIITYCSIKFAEEDYLKEIWTSALNKPEKKKDKIRKVVESWYNEQRPYNVNQEGMQKEYAQNALYKIMEILGVKG